YACRPGISPGSAHFRTIDIDRSITDACPARAVGVMYLANRNAAAGGTFQVTAPGAADIGTVIIYVRIVNDRRPVIDIHDIAVRRIVTVYVRVAYVTLRDKDPVETRNINMQVYLHA